MVDPPGFDHDQSKGNADWIMDVENLEKDQIASESNEKVFNPIDLLNHYNNENYKFKHDEKFNVNLFEMASNI